MFNFSRKKKNLLFMGDSLTAGVYSDGMLRYDRVNYPEIIATLREKDGSLNNWYNIAVSGFTTKDLLNLLNEDLSYNQNTAYNITTEYCYKSGLKNYHHTAPILKYDKKVSELIREADEIIMTIGSNDYIKFADTYSKELKEMISSEGFKNIKHNLAVEVASNMNEIIRYIKIINPDVKIIMFGSYMPNKSAVLSKMFAKSFDRIEQEVYSEVLRTHPEVIYIAIREIFEGNASVYLDNVLNIHPNKIGYARMAKEYKKAVMDVE